jgi:hypothetical protein
VEVTGFLLGGMLKFLKGRCHLMGAQSALPEEPKPPGLQPTNQDCLFASHWTKWQPNRASPSVDGSHNTAVGLSPESRPVSALTVH